MVQEAHGVKGVSRMAGACSEADPSRIQGSVGVPQAHTNSPSGRLRDDFDGPGQFGRNREHTNVPPRRLPEAMKGGHRRSQQIFRRMNPTPAVADERTLKMNSQRTRP